jgi:hypothetical protein
MSKLDAFQAWIKNYTFDELGAKLGEHPVTVWKWYAGVQAPRPKDALKIIKLSGLSWKNIYYNYAVGKRTHKNK